MMKLKVTEIQSKPPNATHSMGNFVNRSEPVVLKVDHQFFFGFLLASSPGMTESTETPRSNNPLPSIFSLPSKSVFNRTEFYFRSSFELEDNPRALHLGEGFQLNSRVGFKLESLIRSREHCCFAWDCWLRSTNSWECSDYVCFAKPDWCI